MESTHAQREIATIAHNLEDIDLGYADGEIAGLAGLASGLNCDTRDGYAAVSAAIRECVTMRTGIEKSRKQMKKAGLEWGRKVDLAAKNATDRVAVIERPLKEMKLLVDEAKRIAKEEMLAAVVREREAKEKAERDRIEAEQKKKNDRIRKEQEAEDTRLAEIRAEFEKEQKRAADENDKLQRENTERKKELEYAKQQVFAEQDRLRKVQDDIDAKVRKAKESKLKAKLAAEQKIIDAENAKIERERKEKQDAADAAVQEERKPDSVKLYEYATSAQRWLDVPELSTNWGKECLAGYCNDVGVALTKLLNHLPSSLTCGDVPWTVVGDDDDYDEEDDVVLVEDVCEDMGE